MTAYSASDLTAKRLSEMPWGEFMRVVRLLTDAGNAVADQKDKDARE